MRRVVLRRAAAEEAKPALQAERVRDRADEHAAGSQHAADLRDERVRELEVLEELARDHRVEARVLERQRLLDVRLHRLDPERGGLLERRSVDVEPDDRVALEEVPRERARAAAEVEDALATPDRRDDQRDALGDEDEVALVPSLAMVLFVALAEIRHAEPTAASCPSEAIVLRRPSSSGISGAHPRICFARVMSGWRTCGSSTGSAS